MAYDKVVDSAVLDEGLKQIADAIREKAGTTDALAFPQAMADAIAAIQGGGATIEPLTITENGTYTAPDGVDGYSPVTVEVKGSGEEFVITDFSYFCYKDARLSLLDKIDTSKGTDFSGMFSYSTKNSVDYYTKNLDTSNGEKFIEMFAFSTAYNSQPPLFDTSKGITFYSMFYNCQRIQSIPLYDTSNGIRFDDMFYGCQVLTTIPELNVSKGVSFDGTFNGCKALTTVPDLNTSNGEDFETMFYNCTSLVAIPKLDLTKARTVSYMFYNCSALANLYLYNIRKTIQIGSDTSWGHLLTVDSLVHTIKELCTVTKSQTLTIGPANLEKIAGLYCRITDDTNEKKPMELCESTDEGAMTLSDYASEKNWLIQ